MAQPASNNLANPGKSRILLKPAWLHALGLGLLLALAGPRALPADPPPSPTLPENPVRYPYSGKLAAFDTQRRLIAIDGRERRRVILLNDATRVTRANQPSTLETAQPGEEIAGVCARDSQGREIAITLRLGPKVESPAPAPPPTLKPIRPPKIIEP